MRKVKEKRPLGRPPTGITPSRSVRLSPAIWDAIDLWQHTRIDKPILTKAGAVRRLLIIALLNEDVMLPDEIIGEEEDIEYWKKIWSSPKMKKVAE